MNNIYLCIGRVYGLALPENTVIKIGEGITITNKADYEINDQEKETDVVSNFGHAILNSIRENDIYLYFVVGISRFEDFTLALNQIDWKLDQLWRIRDSGVSVFSYNYLPLNNSGKPYTISTGCFLTNSKGNFEKVEFSQGEFDLLGKMETEIDPFIELSDLEKGFTSNGTEFHSNRLKEFNEKTTIERALMFKDNARRASELPFKITNYISFLECLFSISNKNIRENVSVSTARFLKRYKGLDFNQTKLLVRDLYQIRSNYIHGTLLKNNRTFKNLKESSTKADEICRTVVNIIIDEKLDVFNDYIKVKSFIRTL